MRLQTFLQCGIVALPAITAIQPPTLDVWALSEFKDHATVRVMRENGIFTRNIAIHEKEERYREGGCIGQDGGLDWVVESSDCSNKPLWKRIDLLADPDLTIDKTQEISVNMPDYALSVSPI
jgi:hypothetical protein